MTWLDGGCAPCCVGHGGALWGSEDEGNEGAGGGYDDMELSVFDLLDMCPLGLHAAYAPPYLQPEIADGLQQLDELWGGQGDSACPLPCAPTPLAATETPSPVETPPPAEGATVEEEEGTVRAEDPTTALQRFDELGAPCCDEPTTVTCPCYDEPPSDELGPPTEPAEWQQAGDALGTVGGGATPKALRHTATRPAKRARWEGKLKEEGVKSEGMKREAEALSAKRPRSVKCEEAKAEQPPARTARRGAGRAQARPVVHQRDRKSTNVKDEVVIRRAVREGLSDGSWVVQDHVVWAEDSANGVPELIGIRELVTGSIFMRTSEAILRNDSAKTEERTRVEMAWLKSKVLQQGPPIEALKCKNNLGKESDKCSKKTKASMQRAFVTPAEFKHVKEEGISNPAWIWRTSDWKIPRSFAQPGNFPDA